MVIWSVCNEVLCNTNSDQADARRMVALMHSLDPLGQRPVSANQNGWIGLSTPLDVQGFDYSTQNYDQWHNQAPNIPSISSETSSAVSDRGEYANDAVGGHVSGYDTNEPSWGETAEGAWGGIGISNGQGILTRAFISGGWTWTGWDYRGEPTPYAWPDTNSHFGILDLCGFEKVRPWQRGGSSSSSSNLASDAAHATMLPFTAPHAVHAPFTRTTTCTHTRRDGAGSLLLVQGVVLAALPAVCASFPALELAGWLQRRPLGVFQRRQRRAARQRSQPGH